MKLNAKKFYYQIIDLIAQMQTIYWIQMMIIMKAIYQKEVIIYIVQKNNIISKN